MVENAFAKRTGKPTFSPRPDGYGDFLWSQAEAAYPMAAVVRNHASSTLGRPISALS